MVIDPKTPLSLSEIMGSLISSVIEAQAQAARATVEFIEEVGLEEGKENAPRDLRKARFRYSKLGADNTPQDFVVEVPLLGLVDIPLIAVSKATFSFTYDVTTTAPKAKATAAPSAAPSAITPLADTATIANLQLAKIASPAIIKGRFTKVARPTGTGGGGGDGGAGPAQESGGLKVVVELEKAPMPVGVERVLEILELAATETPEPDDGDDGGGTG